MPQSGKGDSIYSATHTLGTQIGASHLEWTIFPVQQGFHYCQSGHLDYAVYHSGTAWYLSPMLLMGHLLSCSILTPVQLACEDDCCASLHRMTMKAAFFFFLTLLFFLLIYGQLCNRTPSRGRQQQFFPVNVSVGQEKSHLNVHF